MKQKEKREINKDKNPEKIRKNTFRKKKEKIFIQDLDAFIKESLSD